MLQIVARSGDLRRLAPKAALSSVVPVIATALVQLLGHHHFRGTIPWTITAITTSLFWQNSPGPGQGCLRNPPCFLGIKVITDHLRKTNIHQAPGGCRMYYVIIMYYYVQVAGSSLSKGKAASSSTPEKHDMMRSGQGGQTTWNQHSETCSENVTKLHGVNLQSYRTDHTNANTVSAA